MADQALIIESFRAQAGWCERLGSPFTSSLLSRAADDIAAAGPTGELLEDWQQNPYAAALALRLAGALNYITLDGRAPDLASECSNAKSQTNADAVWQLAADALVDHRAFIRDFIEAPVQTNELRRSICLLGGFLEAAKHYDMPLRIFEMARAPGSTSCGTSTTMSLAARSGETNKVPSV